MSVYNGRSLYDSPTVGTSSGNAVSGGGLNSPGRPPALSAEPAAGTAAGHVACRWFRWDGERWESCLRCRRPWKVHDGVDEGGWRWSWAEWRGHHVRRTWERHWGPTR